MFLGKSTEIAPSQSQENLYYYWVGRVNDSALGAAWLADAMVY